MKIDSRYVLEEFVLNAKYEDDDYDKWQDIS